MFCLNMQNTNDINFPLLFEIKKTSKSDESKLSVIFMGGWLCLTNVLPVNFFDTRQTLR